MKRVGSMGAGVQSSTLALMARDGIIGSAPDAWIFSDTRWEPTEVYRHLGWLVGELGGGITVLWTCRGSIRSDMVLSVEQPGSFNSSPLVMATLTVAFTETLVRIAQDKERLLAEHGSIPSDYDDIGPILAEHSHTVLPRQRAGKRIASLPFHLRNEDGKAAMLRRQCTNEYKIEPITQVVRFLTGRKPRQRKGETVEQWIGISQDEWQRQKRSRIPWITNRYPLLEAKITRQGCLDWLQRNGYPEPPKSSCIGCPFHGNAYWRQLKRNSPGEWQDAVQFDATTRRLDTQGVEADVYLHRSLVPLAEADLRSTVQRKVDAGQPVLPGFEEEEDGDCDSAYCGVNL